MRSFLAALSLCLASCALGDATFGDRWEVLDDAFATDLIENNTWTLTTANATLSGAHQHCAQIVRSCPSYWRLPTEREWADAIGLDGYLNSADDVRPDEPTLPEALDLEAGRFWNTIIAERPSEAYIASFGNVVEPSTGVGSDVNSSDTHLTRCVCTGP